MSQRLEFGTAGLRGVMGPGFNRMNHLVVQQTSQGLCRYLQKMCPERLQQGGVVVGHDARHGSREYALITAAVFISQGVPVHLFPQVVPTPFVAAGVAELGAAAGVMVTASHNPKQYNGYKVYWGNGCQIIPPHDEGIAECILQSLEPWDLSQVLKASQQPSAAAPPSSTWHAAIRAAALHPLVQDPSVAVSSAYYHRLRRNLSFRLRDANASSPQVVYTPLHGVGAPYVRRAFKLLGLPEPYIVPQQEQPDPEFSTVVFPNPEEGKGTWALAFNTGAERGARLLLANDPDADRLAVAEANPAAPGGWQTFSGNEIGILLADWLWTNHRRLHPEVPPGRCAVLCSTVSSKMLGALAAKEGLVFEETLTGFKWLGNRAQQLEEQKGLKVLFAFEEAIGFMAGGMYRDKDGVSAAAVFAEMAAELYAQGTSVSEHLQELYRRYGFFVYRAAYFIADKPAKSAAVFERIRAAYPKALGGVGVLWVRDLGTGLDTSRPDQRATLPWRAGDMMISLGLEGGATLTLRASGTEPKLKYYLEVQGADATASAELAARLEKAVAEELVKVAEAGLSYPVSH